MKGHNYVKKKSNGRNRYMLLISLLLSSMERLQQVAGKSKTITHETVETMGGGLPVLGRGYSVTSNSCQSSCFNVNGTTAVAHSFNYDCKYDYCFQKNILLNYANNCLKQIHTDTHMFLLYCSFLSFVLQTTSLILPEKKML